MKTLNYISLFLLFLFSSSLLNGQIEVVKHDLDHPIDMVFDDERVYVALHGTLPHQGQIVSFDVNNPEKTYIVHFDSLSEYPRALALHNDILYIGFTTYIGMVDLKAPNLVIETWLSDLFFPRCLIFDNDRLYFGEDDRISYIDIGSENPDKVVLFDNLESAPLSMDLDNGNLYIAAGKNILKYNTDSSIPELEVFLTDFDLRIYSIAIVEGVMYIDQRDLLQYDLNNPMASLETFLTEVPLPIGITYYNDNLYFATPRPINNGLFSGKIFKITESIILSDESIENHHLNIYPNPTNGFIQIDGIEFEDYTVRIRNQYGAIVLDSTNKDFIDLQDLQSGIYIVELKYDDSYEVFRERIVVSK